MQLEQGWRSKTHACRGNEELFSLSRSEEVFVII